MHARTHTHTHTHTDKIKRCFLLHPDTRRQYHTVEVFLYTTPASCKYVFPGRIIHTNRVVSGSLMMMMMMMIKRTGRNMSQYDSNQQILYSVCVKQNHEIRLSSSNFYLVTWTVSQVIIITGIMISLLTSQLFCKPCISPLTNKYTYYPDWILDRSVSAIL